MFRGDASMRLPRYYGRVAREFFYLSSACQNTTHVLAFRSLLIVNAYGFHARRVNVLRKQMLGKYHFWEMAYFGLKLYHGAAAQPFFIKLRRGIVPEGPLKFRIICDYVVRNASFSSYMILF